MTMIKKKSHKVLMAFFLIMTIAGRGYSQTIGADSLELTPLIGKVIQTYPTIQQAAEALTAADLKIELARSAYLPNAMATGSFSHIGPVPSLTLPDVGSFSLAPKNPVNASVNINQTITDFGKTKKNIEYEEKSKQLASLGVEQVKQKMSLAVINCYFNLLFYQEAVSIKDQQLATLAQHLKNVEKKAETGSATQYEILSTKVRISGVESQKTDVITALSLQNSYLNMLLGASSASRHRVKNTLKNELLPFNEDSLISIALINRNEMKIAEKKLVVSQAYQDMVKMHEKPVLSAFAAGGWKNGYIPEQEKPKANYAVGLSLQIPLFDASRTSLNTQLAGSALRSVNQEIELTKRNISNEVMESINTMKAAISKTELFGMQLSQATKALELAELKYKSGTLTNLDLLDAENAVSESSLMFLKARIERVLTGYRLKSVLGINLY